MDTIKENFKKLEETARRDGAQLEMLLSGGESLSLGFQKRKLEKFESKQTQMAGLRVILGANQGYAYTENLSFEALQRTYKEALANAKTVQSKETTEIPLMKPLQTQDMSALFNPEDIPMEKKLEVAKALESTCLDADPRVQSAPFGGLYEVSSFARILNSVGLDKEFKQTYYTGNVAALVKEGESSKMDWETFFARKFADVDPVEVAQVGVRRALSRLGAQKLKTGNYAVVLDREVFPNIIEMFAGYLSAQEVFEKRSLFIGKLGQKIANEKFSIVDDPFETRGPAARPFDSEGAPSQKTVIFENGILKNYLTNLEYAQKMKLPHTAHASRGPASTMGISPTNLVMQKGNSTLHQLVSKHDKVVHVTTFSGSMHAGYKASTGDISMPVEGFLYENGQKVGPVEQCVVSGNIFDLLRDIEELGNEYNRPGSSVMCPDVLVKSLSFAGA